jgi:outer membrane biosynthesis protein TonB
MQTLGKAALWVLSVLFILIGLLFFTTNVSAALMALLIGVVLLPPMVGFIDHPAFKIVRWGIAGMAFGLFVTFVPPSEDLQVQQPQASPTPNLSSPNPSPTPTPTPSLTPTLSSPNPSPTPSPTPSLTPALSSPNPSPTPSPTPSFTPTPDQRLTVAEPQPIRESKAGNCECPYDTDRAGRTCGDRSAYSRDGGRSGAQCYTTD